MEIEIMSGEPTVTARPVDRHLSVEEVTARVDGTLSDDIRDGVIAHLAQCAECRAEILEVGGIIRTRPDRAWRRNRTWIPAAAAAALLLILLPRTARDPEVLPHREGAVTSTVGPRPAAPLGRVVSADTIIWSAVTRADAYRVRLFDADGKVLWESVTPDTLGPLPASLTLTAGATYFWRVEARTGFGRWVASDLVEFSLPARRER